MFLLQYIGFENEQVTLKFTYFACKDTVHYDYYIFGPVWSSLYIYLYLSNREWWY